MASRGVYWKMTRVRGAAQAALGGANQRAACFCQAVEDASADMTREGWLRYCDRIVARLSDGERPVLAKDGPVWFWTREWERLEVRRG